MSFEIIAWIKVLGIALLFLAGFMAGQKIMQPLSERIALLKEGDLLFRILESEMRSEKTPLPQLFLQISERTSSVWRDFFFGWRKNFRPDVRSFL